MYKRSISPLYISMDDCILKSFKEETFIEFINFWWKNIDEIVDNIYKSIYARNLIT